jgi:DNA-binding LacI/PurR family transcriptional regulator
MGASLLLDLIARKTPADVAAEQVLPVELLVRESCGAPVGETETG